MIAERISELKTALPQGVALVAVSKFHPVERLLEAYEAGQRLFAESRPQELAAKVPQLPDDISWHFIGHLQTNKLKLVLPYVSLVQSVDSVHLLEAIDRWGAQNGRVIDVLLEVHIASDATKQGFSPEEIMAITAAEVGWAGPSVACGHPGVPQKAMAFWGPHPRPHKREGPAAEGRGRGREATATDGSRPQTEAEYGHVRLRGLMGMATLTEDENVIESDFQRIQDLFEEIKAAHPEWPWFDQLSIGMSGDWPIAVRHGATMVRIGTDIFGPREY